MSKHPSDREKGYLKNAFDRARAPKPIRRPLPPRTRLGLTPESAGASVYHDAEGELRVAITTPEVEAIQMLLDGLGVDSIRELHRLVEEARFYSAALEPIRAELRAAGIPEDLLPLGDIIREDDPNTILQWIEAGFPPWGCLNCRGAEYGPDGVPCAACGGRSDLIQPPERAAKILAMFNDAQHRAVRDATA